MKITKSLCFSRINWNRSVVKLLPKFELLVENWQWGCNPYHLGGRDKRIPGGLLASQPKPMGSPGSGPRDPVSRGQEGRHLGRYLRLASIWKQTCAHEWEPVWTHTQRKILFFQIKIVKDSGVSQDEIKSSLSYWQSYCAAVLFWEAQFLRFRLNDDFVYWEFRGF